MMEDSVSLGFVLQFLTLTMTAILGYIGSKWSEKLDALIISVHNIEKDQAGKFATLEARVQAIEEDIKSIERDIEKIKRE